MLRDCNVAAAYALVFLLITSCDAQRPAVFEEKDIMIITPIDPVSLYLSVLV
jgi:hypothetical protein